MSYIGQTPTSTAFLTDQFSGNGSTTTFTMSVAPATTTSVLVSITGVLQDPTTYSVSGTTLTFSAAPPAGTGNISVRYLGIPASGVTTTAYRTVTEFTATAGQTTFTPPSYTVGFINVYRNGVRLGSADYTASNGTTVVLASAAALGDLVTTESFYVSSVLNALPQSGGTVSGNLVVTGTETVPTITSPSATALTLQTNNGTTAMTIDTSQNVGIGTTSPSSKLQCTGVVASGGNGGVNGYFQLNRTDATNLGSIEWRTSGDEMRYSNRNGGFHSFYTSSAERMRIDYSGNLLVGTTSSLNFAASNANGTQLSPTYLAASSSSGTGLYIKRYTTTGEMVGFWYGLNQIGSITTNGTSTTYATSSDYRLKENIAPMQNALGVVAQLNPVTYTWKSTGEDGQGFIAHELQEVVPDCVTGEKDAVDDEGKPIYQGIDTSFLVATLTKAIQEQQAIINELKSRIETLENK